MTRSAQRPERILTDPAECDLSRADYNEQLSATGFDEAEERFFATLDRVLFSRPGEVAAKVLETHGYARNLENLLACLDQMQFGVRAAIVGKPGPDGQPVAKGQLPCVQFQLPNKDRVGPLLNQLYNEIEAYEAELARLHQKRAASSRKQTTSQLRRQVAQLQKQNKALQAKVAELSHKLTEVQRSHADVSRALAAQNYLPAHVRSAAVHEVDLRRRYVALKAGRRVFSVPLVALWNLPREGEPCLVSIQNGAVIGVFFHEDPRPPAQVQVAEVLFVSGERCKIRDDGRRLRVIEAQNRAEAKLLATLHRGERLLLFLDQGELVRFAPCQRSDTRVFSTELQAALARFAINAAGNKEASDG